MENRAHALIAGLFTLLLGAAIVTAAMWLSGETYERVKYVLESPRSVAGLNVQATVRLRGVDVGKVESIGFDPENPRLILIGIKIRAGTPLTRSTIAQLGTIGLTGLTYIRLEDDGTLPEPLPPSTDKSARIKVVPSLMEQLAGSGRDLVEEVRTLAVRVNDLLSEKNQAQLVQTLARLEAASERIITMAKAVEPAAASVPQVAADARKVLANTDELVASLKDLTQRLTQRVDMLDRVAKGVEQVGSATQSASGALQSASGALREDTLPRVNLLLEDLARTSRDLDRLVNQLNEQPASVVYGRMPPAPGPGEPGFDPQRGSKR